MCCLAQSANRVLHAFMSRTAVAVPPAIGPFSAACSSGGVYTVAWSKNVKWRVTNNDGGSTGYATVIASSRAEVVVGTDIRIHVCSHNPCIADWKDSKYGEAGPPIHLQLCAAPAVGPAVAGLNVELEAAEALAEPAPPPAHAAVVPSEIEAVPNSSQPPVDIVADALAIDAATPVSPEPPSSGAAVPPELEAVPSLPESPAVAEIACSPPAVAGDPSAEGGAAPDDGNVSMSDEGELPEMTDSDSEYADEGSESADGAVAVPLPGAAPVGAPLQPVAAAPAALPVSGDLAVVKCVGALSTSQRAERNIIERLLTLAREIRRPRSYVGQSFFILFGLSKRCLPFLWIGENRCNLLEIHAPWAQERCSRHCVVDAAACVLVAQDAGLAVMKPVTDENPLAECGHFVSLVAVADTGLETAGSSFQAFYNRLGNVAMGTVVDGDCGIDVACQMLGLPQTLEQRSALRED